MTEREIVATCYTVWVFPEDDPWRSRWRDLDTYTVKIELPRPYPKTRPVEQMVLA